MIRLWLVSVMKSPTNEVRYNAAVFEHKALVTTVFDKCSLRGMRYPDGCPEHGTKCDEQQVRARNKAISMVPDSGPISNWMFILDSDELVFPSMEDIMATVEDLDARGFICADVLEFRSDMLSEGQVRMRPRLIKKLKGMEYMVKHDQLYYRGENILAVEYQRPRLLNIGFLHTKTAQNIVFEAIQVEEVNA